MSHLSSAAPLFPLFLTLCHSFPHTVSILLFSPYHLYPNSPAVIKSYPTLVTINFRPHSLIIFQFPFHTKPFSTFGSQVNSTQLPPYRQFSCVAKTQNISPYPPSRCHRLDQSLLSTRSATSYFLPSFPQLSALLSLSQLLPLLSLSQLPSLLSLPQLLRLPTSFIFLAISSGPPPGPKPPIRGRHLSCIQPPHSSHPDTAPL